MRPLRLLQVRGQEGFRERGAAFLAPLRLAAIASGAGKYAFGGRENTGGEAGSNALNESRGGILSRQDQLRNAAAARFDNPLSGLLRIHGGQRECVDHRVNRVLLLMLPLEDG